MLQIQHLLPRRYGSRVRLRPYRRIHLPVLPESSCHYLRKFLHLTKYNTFPFLHDVHGNQENIPAPESLPRKARTFHSALFLPRICLISTCPFPTAHCFHSFCVHSYHLVWIFFCYYTALLVKFQDYEIKT